MRHAMLVLMVVAMVLSWGAGLRAEEPDSADKTLSPYFLIKSGASDVEQLPLKSTSAAVNVAGVIADVTVMQVYKNEGQQAIEAIYVFPASTRAAVYGMKMSVGDRTIEARIKERETAKKEYEQAKQEGKTASLLEQQRPNVFQMNVANILPGDLITVELRYTELLVPEGGVYEFVYPTVVGPRYSNKKAADAAPADKWIANPFFHQGEKPPYAFDIAVTLSTGVPVQDVACPTHKTSVTYDGPSLAKVVLDESEKAGGNRDFVLRYRLTGGQVHSGLLLYQGEEENFFLLMVQPPKRVTTREIPPREYIFIVDVSGSMHGFPLDTSKKLLRDLISNLRPTDRFNVLLFSGTSALLSESSLAATEENLRRGIDFIDRQQGSGGTELLPALERALRLPRTEGFARSVVIATDGYVGVELEAFTLIRESLDQSSFFAFGIGSSVNRFLIEGMARAGAGEPFIVTGPEQAAERAEAMRTYIQSPVLTNVSVDFGQFDAYEVEPPSIPDVLAERPVVVFGKWRGERAGAIRVTGTGGREPYEESFEVGKVGALPANAALKYLWARQRVSVLGDYNKLGASDGRVKEITALGLKYSLLTAYTSFIAVDTTPRRVGDLKSVKQPLPLPQGVSDLAIGDCSISTTPEPETWMLILVALGVVGLVVLKKLSA